jgi:hypothetical protein
VPRINGLKLPTIGDIIKLDPAIMNSTRLDDLLELCRRCGINTTGITTHGAAARQLVDKGRIEV